MPGRLSRDLISAAIEGFEAQKRRLDEQIRELRAMLPSNGAGASAPTRGPRKRRRMSADARKRIAEAQRKRWAAIRGESGTAPMKQHKPKRKLSAAGRKRIIEANRKRWAATRGAAARTAGA